MFNLLKFWKLEFLNVRIWKLADYVNLITNEEW